MPARGARVIGGRLPRPIRCITEIQVAPNANKWFATGVVALAAVGCKAEKTRHVEAATAPLAASSEAADAGPAPAARPLNVLLVTVDAMRADMPWQGYARPIAPTLTRLAAESVVYTNAYAVSSDTAKSVPAMLTGRYPSSLYRSGWYLAGYPKSDVFLAEVLHDAGVRTIGWQAHAYFDPSKGLSQGFDVWEIVPGLVFDPQADPNVTSPALTELGEKLLSQPENTGGRFFAWSHYVDPHEAYKKHAECPDWGDSPRDRYDSEICFTDLWLGKLFNWAAGQPWWKDTAVILTSDHGEAFGEHGAHRHGFHLWQVLVRVPLIIRVPGVAPRRIEKPRSAIDLSRTIADLMGVALPDSFGGKSLVPEIRGLAQPDDREPIVLDQPEDTLSPFIRAIIEGGYKIIQVGKSSFSLFNLDEDSGEEHELSKREPEVLARMKRRLAEVSASIPEVEPFGEMKLKSGRIARGKMGPAKSR
jgi:choline-sulfatase